MLWLWISPTPVPFCLVPRQSTNGVWWVQDNGNALPGRAAVMYGGFMIVFFVAVTIVVLPDAWQHEEDRAWLIGLVPGLLAASSIVVWGLYLWTSSARIEFDPRSERLSLVESEPGFSEQTLARSAAGECTLLIHEVTIKLDNKVAGGTLRGFAVSLRIEDWRFVLACQRTREQVAECIESFPPWLKNIPQEEAPVLRRRGVLSALHRW
jgi:hypothetical protein